MRYTLDQIIQYICDSFYNVLFSSLVCLLSSYPSDDDAVTEFMTDIDRSILAAVSVAAASNKVPHYCHIILSSLRRWSHWDLGLTISESRAASMKSIIFRRSRRNSILRTAEFRLLPLPPAFRAPFWHKFHAQNVFTNEWIPFKKGFIHVCQNLPLNWVRSMDCERRNVSLVHVLGFGRKLKLLCSVSLTKLRSGNWE